MQITTATSPTSVAVTEAVSPMSPNVDCIFPFLPPCTSDQSDPAFFFTFHSIYPSPKYCTIDSCTAYAVHYVISPSYKVSAIRAGRYLRGLVH